MSMQLIHQIQNNFLKKKIPEIKSGYTVRIHQKIKEGDRERIQIFEGLIIKINSGHGTDKTFTVRKVVSGIGVEKIFPVHSKSIERIELIKKAKVRRAKLYYTRSLFGKKARMKEEYLKDILGIKDEKAEEVVSKGDKEEVKEEIAKEEKEEVKA